MIEPKITTLEEILSAPVNDDGWHVLEDGRCIKIGESVYIGEYVPRVPLDGVCASREDDRVAAGVDGIAGIVFGAPRAELLPDGFKHGAFRAGVWTHASPVSRQLGAGEAVGAAVDARGPRQAFAFTGRACLNH